MLGRLHFSHRHLMRAPSSFDLLAVDFFGAGPTLGRTQDDHRPARPAHRLVIARLLLNRLDFGDDRIEGRRHFLVHRLRLGAFNEIRPIAVAAQESFQLLMADARQHGRVGDLVAV